ncbi:MAG: hypothetical protein ACP5FH_00775 [Terracidiphilus sp.]
MPAQHAAAAQPDFSLRIAPGQAAVPLHGPWKFAAGGSPIDPKTGKPPWADAEFDGSRWENADLTREDGVFDPAAG